MATYRTSVATFNTSSGSKTATLVPVVGDFIVIVSANSGSTATPTISDNNAAPGTYTLIDSALKNSSADKLFIHVRNEAMSNTSSTIFTMAPGTTTGGGLVVLAITGISLWGAVSWRSSGKQENQASGGTPAPVMNNAALTANLCLSAVFNGTNPGGVTAPTGSWVRQQNLGYNTPASGLDVATIDNGFTSNTVTWGSTSASAFCSMAVELDISALLGQIWT